MPTAANIMPKAAPNSAATSALAEATDALNGLVGELKEARALNPAIELEMKVRRLYHLTTIVSEWASAANFPCPASAGDDADTRREWGDQHDRLMFGLDEIAEVVSDLHDAFRSWRAKQ